MKIEQKIKENLTEGMILNSYRELCKVLNVDIKGGNSKMSQMKEIERYVRLEKEGYKFIVMEIYEIPLQKIDGRINNGGNISNPTGNTGQSWTITKYPQYDIADEKNHANGVYGIVLGNDIYIGSTTIGFRKRFILHMHATDIPEARELLDNGGKYQILWEYPNEIMNVKEVRRKEDNYIFQYIQSDKWNVVNKQRAYKHNDNSYFDTLKVKKGYTKEIIDCLSENELLKHISI